MPDRRQHHPQLRIEGGCTCGAHRYRGMAHQPSCPRWEPPKRPPTWGELTDDQRDAVRTLLEDSVAMMGPWGLPSDILERGMSEADWLAALDAGLERLRGESDA
jgi:hypothetical protein